MRSEGAVITTSDSILFQLVRDAKDQNFKQVSNIVKQHLEQGQQNTLMKLYSSKM